MKLWRIGYIDPLNVYEGNRQVCQCNSALDARSIVLAMNRNVPEEINRSPKPTPGPWYRDPDNPTMILNAPLQQATEIIAQTSGEANARLIAAAPDLLDACCKAAGSLVLTINAFKMLGSAPPNDIFTKLSAVNAAIAKAEGRDA